MNKLILFSKMLKERDVPGLIALAGELGVDGYDLCVRPGYPINPDNAASKLVEAVKAFREAGLDIPMVTANFDFLFPDHPAAEPLLSAMNQADVRLIKLGYYSFDPARQDYWIEVDRIRQGLTGWQKMGQRHNIRICYHTHCQRCMGLNAGTLAHLLRGFDPHYIGAYLDPCHLAVEGEEFAYAVAILKPYFSIIALKDVMIHRTPVNGHGSKTIQMVPAGEGLVDWTTVFSDLVRAQFAGPLSVHCEFKVPANRFLDSARREVMFFRKRMQEAWE